MIKTILKITAGVAVIAIGGIQFIRPEMTNPPIDQGKTIEAAVTVPKDVAGILERSCNDCHSNKTFWPWYSNIAPFSWSLADHVSQGREELNFSEWGNYSDKRRLRKLKEVCEEVEEGSMPHYQYVWVHRDAALSEAEVRKLCGWTESFSKGASEAGS